MEVYTTWRKCNKLAMFMDNYDIYIEAQCPYCGEMAKLINVSWGMEAISLCSHVLLYGSQKITYSQRGRYA